MRTSIARNMAIARKMTQLTMLAGMAGVMSFAPCDSPVFAQQAAPAAEPAAAAAPKKAKQKPKSKPTSQEAKAAKKDPAVAQAQIDAGVASLQTGKADLAVQQFSSALTGGSLPSNLMARAHYQRGIAYRKQSKPALAISDLTHALWLKNGLNETERADALQNRIAAYRDAGLPDQEDAGGGNKTAGMRTAATDTSTATTGSTGSINAAKPSAGLAPTQESASASSGGGLGGFFGNLFGGSSSNAATENAAAPAAKVEPAVSAWSANTEVKPASAARSAKPVAAAPEAALPWQQPEATKAAPPAKPTRVASAAGGAGTAGKATGRYQLQVAQFKTAEEAQAAAVRIKQQFVGELAGREATVTAVSAGGFGTLHRVSFGPFLDPAEWKSLCPKLLSAGSDCQPLAQ